MKTKTQIAVDFFDASDQLKTYTRDKQRAEAAIERATKALEDAGKAISLNMNGNRWEAFVKADDCKVVLVEANRDAAGKVHIEVKEIEK